MSLDRVVDIGKALGDRSRVRALFACRRGELCVCQITALLDLAPSTVSRHLAVLRHAGLLLSRKRGRWIHYRLPGDAATRAVRDALGYLFGALGRDAQIVSDRRTLDAILRMDPDRLCRKQRCLAGKAKSR